MFKKCAGALYLLLISLSVMISGPSVVAAQQELPGCITIFPSSEVATLKAQRTGVAMKMEAARRSGAATIYFELQPRLAEIDLKIRVATTSYYGRIALSSLATMGKLDCFASFAAYLSQRQIEWSYNPQKNYVLYSLKYAGTNEYLAQNVTAWQLANAFGEHIAPSISIADAIIKDSRSEHQGNCPCPYNQDARGNQCGQRSAWSRTGGKNPYCYHQDVPVDLIQRVRQLTLQGYFN